MNPAQTQSVPGPPICRFIRPSPLVHAGVAALTVVGATSVAILLERSLVPALLRPDPGTCS